MKTYFLFLLICVSSINVFSSNAMVCACCTERGTYSISTKKPTQYELDELKRIRFGTINLYATAADEGVKGISAVSENYSVSGLLDGSAWKFNIKDDAAKMGTLNLTKPVSVVEFMADLYDSDGGGNGPILYKEWRFKYRVGSGTGIFKNGIAPATEYFLVLQGRGNFCTNAEDFKNWRLEITGKKADYAFFGDLQSPL